MKKTLLILAAGMGSRFGGLKQAEPIGPNGEFIIDYSIYDAKLAGFTKIVFVIKEENYDLFRETVGKRVENQIEVAYVFQKIEDVPSWVTIPKDRVKPWGTGHAILAAKDVIHENFAVINADDFYGRTAIMSLSKFMDQPKTDAIAEFTCVGYQVQNTMTENGSVKRGVMKVKDSLVTEFIESVINKEDGKIIAHPFKDGEAMELQPNDPVSMSLFGFTPALFDYIEENMETFFHKNSSNLEKCEYIITDILHEMITTKKARVHCLYTNAVWLGVTYLEDKEAIVDGIAQLIVQGEYKKNLWS